MCKKGKIPGRHLCESISNLNENVFLRKPQKLEKSKKKFLRKICQNMGFLWLKYGFCSHMIKHGSEKTRILTNFTQSCLVIAPLEHCDKSFHLGVVVIITAQFHSRKPGLWFLLEIRLNAFRWPTMPQKEFIMMTKTGVTVIISC